MAKNGNSVSIQVACLIGTRANGHIVPVYRNPILRASFVFESFAKAFGICQPALNISIRDIVFKYKKALGAAGVGNGQQLKSCLIRLRKNLKQSEYQSL